LAEELGYFVGAIKAKQKARKILFLIVAVWKINRVVVMDFCAADVALHSLLGQYLFYVEVLEIGNINNP